MRIRPRGLVNAGNLCFANAVLQVLVYCPPFWRFFTDLGRLLPPAEESKTPLVDATIRFVKEFTPKERLSVEGKGKGKGKGVDRYGANGLVREEVEEDIMESFMPTYVHDALKEKKRFDHMRVSGLSLLFGLLILTCIGRAVIKRTQKSSLDSTLIHWKRSCWHFPRHSTPKLRHPKMAAPQQAIHKKMAGLRSASATVPSTHELFVSFSHYWSHAYLTLD